MTTSTVIATFSFTTSLSILAYLKLPYKRKGEFSPPPHFLKKDDSRRWEEGESKDHLPESSIKTL